MDVVDRPSPENPLSFVIIGCAIEVHKALGPGLIESAYQKYLEIALRNRGLSFEKEKRIPLVFQKTVVPDAYRIDLIVEGKVIVEIKSVYLRITGLRLGLLINFNVPSLPDGIRRVVNKLV